MAIENGQPSELTIENVHALLSLFEQSDYEHLEVQIGQTRLVVDKTSAHGPSTPNPLAPAPAGPAVTTGRTAPADVPAAESTEPSTIAPPVPAARAHPELDDLLSHDNITVVAAPVVGVFYRASEPGADPFTEVGEVVSEGQTLGLIELMKMFNGVQAPCGGKVVAVLASDAEFVEYGQPLIALRKDAT